MVQEKQVNTDVLLEKELAFWGANQDTLRQRYPNKWLLIRGDEVLGHYDTYEDMSAADREFNAPLLQFVFVPNDSVNMPTISVASD